MTLRKAAAFLGLLISCTTLLLAQEQQSILGTESIKLIKGKELTSADLKGKVVVITNIATQCGYTGQLDDLEALYQKYKDKGLLVVGVPSNDFGGQTPEGNQEVAKFCKINYGVTFPLALKQSVKGKDKTELFKKLTQADKSADQEIKWNFEKFIISRDGQLLGRFRSDVGPMSTSVTQLIEKNL